MPDMNGVDLAEAIRADADLAGTTLFLLSSGILTDERARMERLGLTVAFQKPLRSTVLLRSLQKLWAPSATQPGSAAPASAPAPARSARVLIAEDNAINQTLARRMVEKLGYPCDVVADGGEVLRALEKTEFDLILMDCQMPGMDGYEATREIRLREEGTGRRVAIVAMTANAVEGERERCLSFGMDDYLAKPVKLPVLAEMLQRWLPTESAT